MNNDDLCRLSGSPGCVVCDNNGSNPRSLGLPILWNEAERAIHIPCTPDETWCGYSKIVHGGLVATVLDEAMAWVVKQVSGDWAFTADFKLRLKKAVEPGREYTAVATVAMLDSRLIQAEARFVDDEGGVAAMASARFMPAKGRALPREAADARE